MPTINKALELHGALVEITVGWSAHLASQQKAAGTPIPTPRQLTALIDTGADNTCLDSDVIQQLALPLGGFTLSNAPALTGLSFSMMFPASLTIRHPSGASPRNLVLRQITIMQLSLASLPYQALIGRDVLARCRFLFDGPKGRFKLAY